MKTTLEQWRMLQAVVEHGSFARAAEAIHKSQSSINSAVHKLQESLGLQLLTTEGRRTVLTDTGALILRRGKLVLEEVRRIEEVAQQLSQGVEASVKVAVDSIFPYDNLYRAFAGLSAEFPHTRVELIETILSGSNEMLLSGEVAIAISPSPPEGYPPERLCQVEFVGVAGRDHPLITPERPLTHADLKAHRQIVIRDSAQNRKANSGWLQAEQRWTVSNLATSIDLIRRGFGFAWLPRNKIAAELAAGELRLLPLDTDRNRLVSLFLVIDDEDKLGPAGRYLIANIRRLAQDRDFDKPKP